MTDVIVLGAGIVGVSTALYLQEAGANVILVEKGGPTDAASFGNAGVIQAEAVEPYALPRNPGALLRILTGRDNSVHFTIRGIAANLGPLASYWRHSQTDRHARISRIYARLIAQAMADHEHLITLSGADNLIARDGYLALYRSAAALDRAAASARRIERSYGVPSRIIAPDGLRERGLIVRTGGAIHWTEPMTVADPGDLVAAYHRAFADRGGATVTGDAASLTPHGTGWRIVHGNGSCTAKHAVLALGAATPMIARPLGYRFPVIPKRGYHQHFRGGETLRATVVIPEDGIVLAPMRNGLRILTGAAFVGRSDARIPQLERARTIASRLTGAPLNPISPTWNGLRPCMPDMLPVVGRGWRHDGLWFHFGHGHQGLTLGPTTARMLAREVTGQGNRLPEFDALSPARFA